MSSTKDLQLFDDELQGLTESIREIVRAADSLSDDQRAAKIAKGQDLMKQAQRTLHNYKVELRAVRPTEAAPFERKCQDHNAQLAALKDQLAAKKAGGGAAKPAGGGAGADAAGGVTDDPIRAEARQIGQRIEKTQLTTIDVLKRAVVTVEETKKIGEEAAETLQAQTDQMRRMDEKLDKMQTDVKRAKAEITAFMRRMMTDKIIICFALLIISGIIAVVVLKVKEPQLLGGSPATTVAPPPATTHI